MAAAHELQVGLIVSASGENGRFEVVEIKDHTARIRLIANNKDTGEPVKMNYIVEVPLSVLTPLEGLRHWYLVECKICGGSHREPDPANIPIGVPRNSMPIRMEQRVVCPKFPDKSEVYDCDDWDLLTEAEFKAATEKKKL